MYTAGREQVRERHNRCTQQGREMHRRGEKHRESIKQP